MGNRKQIRVQGLLTGTALILRAEDPGQTERDCPPCLVMNWAASMGRDEVDRIMSKVAGWQDRSLKVVR